MSTTQEVISQSAWAGMSTEERQGAVDRGARIGDPVTGCQFHGGESGHNDYACPSADFNPPMRDAWCECDPATETDRMRFYVFGGGGHGWYCGDCRGIIQTG